MWRVRVKKGGGRARSLFERKILVKSPEPDNKERFNYEQKLRGKIITENYQLVYEWRRKVEIYRDTGVSKKNVRDIKNILSLI